MIELPDDLQPLETIRQPDWDLIEHLAELAGRRYRRRGDVYLAGCIEAERVRQVMEMGSDAILNIILHLAFTRKDDLIEALEIADINCNLTPAILDRAASQATERRLCAVAETRRQAESDAWQKATVKPRHTLTWLRAMLARLADVPEVQHPALWRAMALRLGVDPRQPAQSLQEAIYGRLRVLQVMADDLHRQAMKWQRQGDAAEQEMVLASFDAMELLQVARDAGGWPAVAEGLGVGVGSVVGAYRLAISFELLPQEGDTAAA